MNIEYFRAAWHGAVCAAAIVALVSIAMLAQAVRVAIEDVPGRVDAGLATIRHDVDSNLDATRADVLGIAVRADKRTGEALDVVRAGLADADIQIGGLRSDVNGQMTAVNSTLALAAEPYGDLARRITLIPDQLAADRETKGLIAETMGVLGATKITMGQIAKASKTFDDRWPSLLDSADSSSKAMTGIFVNVQRFTDKATAPCKGWCVVKESFGVINGSIRAAGAAGVF
jgi:hypothetical protein